MLKRLIITYKTLNLLLYYNKMTKEKNTIDKLFNKAINKDDTFKKEFERYIINQEVEDLKENE